MKRGSILRPIVSTEDVTSPAAAMKCSCGTRTRLLLVRSTCYTHDGHPETSAFYREDCPACGHDIDRYELDETSDPPQLGRSLTR